RFADTSGDTCPRLHLLRRRVRRWSRLAGRRRSSLDVRLVRGEIRPGGVPDVGVTRLGEDRDDDGDHHAEAARGERGGRASPVASEVTESEPDGDRGVPGESPEPDEE